MNLRITWYKIKIGAETKIPGHHKTGNKKHVNITAIPPTVDNKMSQTNNNCKCEASIAESNIQYFGGVEGGATHSRLIICNEAGECVAEAAGRGTNHWTLGIPECARRIADMAERAKAIAGISSEKQLTSLGLSLSGCEHDDTNIELENELHKSFPNLAKKYVVNSDTMGSIFTASPIGGMVVISGTGSNTHLRNPNGETYNCGGWGYFLGDEGSAWYIAHRALKLVFDDMDNFAKCPFEIEHVWSLIKQHFNVNNRHDLLPHCYAKFDKPFFASLCKLLAEAATEGDALCQHLFHEAGRHLARNINALLPYVQSELVQNGDLSVVCVGSVWHSWNLLRDGFMQEINSKNRNFGLKLISITKSMAFGACYLGADGAGFNLPRDYTHNYVVMFNLPANILQANGMH